ncbi:MAG: lipoate--protein ligase family protein [Candidatus Methanomethylicota archaeon]|uniref:Lipoate--protein ligase family protein n=1 Tax=Thermoproteota archaeon TaxID=2056631 RepID=A0A497ERS3_9CREN|nr:MAG: lipoate--protein ligase family protein [Candidatus Verstraetearchaeota archaeon]
MIGESVLKVSGGKMIRARIAFDREILDVRISGDFFLYPEEAIHELEKQVKEARSEEDIMRLVEAFFREKHVVVVGASASDFVNVLLNAFRKAKG